MITKLGKQKLEEKIVALKAELLQTYEKRSEAAEEGDLKENSAYIAYGEQSHVLNAQIIELIEDLKSSVIVNQPTQTSTIVFGSKVTLRFENDKRVSTFVLVGKNDAHLFPDWISCDSPIGIAILNRKKGDSVEVNGQLVSILDISIGNI
jgi:transcription elongation factor GreA